MTIVRPIPFLDRSVRDFTIYDGKFHESTADSMILTTPTVTGGSFASPTITTPTVTGGSFSSPVITNPTISGEYTFNSPVLNTPTVTGGTQTSPTINTPTITTPTITGGTQTSPTITTPKINSPTFSGEVRFGTGANYSRFEEDGTLTFNGDATVWDDVLVPVTSTKVGGSKDPGFAVFQTDGGGSQGVFAYLFDKASEEELYFVCQVPHSYKVGTDIEAHVHWSPIDTGTGKVVWGLEYSWASIEGNFGATTIVSGESAGTGTARNHIVKSFGYLNGTGKGISSILACRVFRKATDSNDTYDNDAALHAIDFHFQKDTLGSRGPYTK